MNNQATNLTGHFADYIRQERLDDLAIHNLPIVREMKLPLLHHLTHLTDEQLLALTRESLAQFLEALAQGIPMALEELEKRMQLWNQNQLPLVKKIAEMHGGRIGIESVPGQGSTFSFTASAA